MHTKKWSRKQCTWPNNGFLGCGGHGCLGLFERHKYEVVGSSNRSILYLGTSELKVISMIYAPSYLMRRRSEGVVDRSQTHTSPNVPAVAHKKETLESNQRCTTIT